MIVQYFKQTKEADLCSNFLEWQQRGGKLIANGHLSMKSSGGKGLPVITEEDGVTVVAVGFINLVEEFGRRGLFLI